MFKSWCLSNSSINTLPALNARIVESPLIEAEMCVKTGDLVILSRRIRLFEDFMHIFRRMKTINKMNAMGIMYSGLTIIVTAMAPRASKLYCNASNRTLGKASSVAPMSFVNRFKMRPDGFSLKNRSVVEINPMNIPSCKFCEAVKQSR